MEGKNNATEINKMTWEETVLHIRNLKEYEDLVEDAFISADLSKNVENYYSGEEYQATVTLLSPFLLDNKQEIKILDIGAGNGITSIAFARDGFNVYSVEPDESDTVGIGAINILKELYGLNNLQVHKAFAENLPFANELFDIVYARQALHHAHSLHKFVSEAYRVLKPGGVFLTVRDHVVFNTKEKRIFLSNHPLQKFYQGENAFTLKEYKKALTENKFRIVKIYSQYESVINYSPLKKSEYFIRVENYSKEIKLSLQRKLGILSKLPGMFKVYKMLMELKYDRPYNEKKLPGRPYTFLSVKNE